MWMAAFLCVKEQILKTDGDINKIIGIIGE